MREKQRRYNAAEFKNEWIESFEPNIVQFLKVSMVGEIVSKGMFWVI